MVLGRSARQALAVASKQPDDRHAALRFDLAHGAATHVAFTPTAAGYIRATAAWTGPALKMQLIRPDGSVAADAIGESPLTLHFHLRRGEFARNRGKTYRVVLMNTVVSRTGETATGELTVIWGEPGGEASSPPAA
jgi:hypothetical protein